MLHERETMRRIRQSIADKILEEPFRSANVNRALKIGYAGVFLPKHRLGNPGRNTEHFVQIERGLYRLNSLSEIANL